DETLQRRHATWFAAQAQTLMSSGFGPNARANLLRQDLPNARAALEWAEMRRDAVLGLQLAGFTRLWEIVGAAGEARRWMTMSLALDTKARAEGAPTAPMRLRAARLNGLARLLLNHGDLKHAEEAAQDAVALAQEIADPALLGDTFATRGMIAQAGGDSKQAIAAFTQSVAHAGPDTSGEAGYRAYFYLAEVARHEGDIARAHALLESALAGAEATQSAWDCAVIMTMLAHLERQMQDNNQALRRYLDSLNRFHS